MYRARNLKTRKNTNLLFEAKEGLQFIIFDVESTGTDPNNDRIVEFSAIKCEIHNKNAIEIDSINVYIKPPFLMEQKVIDIHGITNEFLADKPNENEAFNRIKEFFGQTPVVVGHNIDFDINMVNALYIRNEECFTPVVSLDTLEMARDILNEKESDNYKLQTLAELFGLDGGLTFHNSFDDVKATLRLLLVFYDEYSKLPPITPKQTVYVNSIYYWKGMNKNQAGIWLETNLGRMFYSTLNKAWYSSKIDLDMVDIDKLEKEILGKMGITLKDFGRLTEKKFSTIKSELKSKGIYL